jgi:hypothetical protein
VLFDAEDEGVNIPEDFNIQARIYFRPENDLSVADKCSGTYNVLNNHYLAHSSLMTLGYGLNYGWKFTVSSLVCMEWCWL